MNDNDIFVIIRNILLAGLNTMGISGVQVKQNFQADQGGVPTPPAIFFHKIAANRYGFPGRRSIWNEANQNFDHVETTWRRATYQITGLAIQDPSDLSQLTAADLVEAASDILQLDAARDMMKAEDESLNIERIQDIRTPYFTDERKRYEQSPSFDFVLSYQKRFVSTAQPVTAKELNFNRV